jgi:DNA-binding response OmpR family regulator
MNDAPRNLGRVFVVDDEPETLRLVVRALTREGYDVKSF